MEKSINKNELLGINPTRIKARTFQEPTFGFLINIIPAFIWALVITDQALPWELTFWYKFWIGLAFIAIYVMAFKIPFLIFLPAIASTIMFVGLIWVPFDLISVSWVRIIFKAIIAILIGGNELFESIKVTMKVFK